LLASIFAGCCTQRFSIALRVKAKAEEGKILDLRQLIEAMDNILRTVAKAELISVLTLGSKSQEINHKYWRL
jgi:hypothetical protein